MKDSIATIRQSAHTFLSGTVLSRLSGMLRDMSMAYAFGTHSSIAGFMVAFRFAHLFRRLLGEGALQSTFIPEFEALRHESLQRALAFFGQLLLALAITLITIIGLGCSGLAASLWWGHFSSSNQQIIFFSLLMLPSLFFICLFGLNASLLQCEKIYFIPSIAPVAFNCVWIASVFGVRHLSPDVAMPWLAGGVALACFCQWLFTVPHTWKILSQVPRCSWLKARPFFSKDLRLFIKPLSLGILGVAASQVNHAIDSVFARFAEAEGPALLWYAIRLQQLPLALFGIAVAGAVLPPLSRALREHRWDDYHHFLHDALRRTWIFVLPFMAALFVMGDSAVNLIYGRGDFGLHSVAGTTSCLWAYNIGLLPAALVLVLAPASYAQNNYFLPAISSVMTMLLNLVLNTFFITSLGWGAMSIAIATSLSAWANFFWLSWVLSRKISLSTPFFSKDCLISSLATLVAFLGTYGMRLYIQHLPIKVDPILLPQSFNEQFSTLCYQALTFGGLFLMMTYATRGLYRLLIALFYSKSEKKAMAFSFNQDH